MKLNKRGGEQLLGENTIGLIIAIVGILLILVILWILAGMQNGNKEETQAKAMLQDLSNKLNAMSPGDIENEPIYAPLGWTLVSFDQNTKVLNGFTVPSAYTFKDSICIYNGNKKTVFCQTLVSPLLDQNQLFIHYIEGFKKFSIGYDGNNFQIGMSNLDIKKQNLVDQSVFSGYTVDSSWKNLGSISITEFSTPYEGDYISKYNDPWKESSVPDRDASYYCNLPDDQKRFYEMVMCYGYGLGENFSLYSRDTIKATKEDSTIFTGCPDCELGYTDLRTDPTIGRTVFVGKETSDLYLGRIIHLEMNCDGVEENCKQECEKWNDRDYVIEGVDPTGKLTGIILFVGGGIERTDDVSKCLPSSAKVMAGPIMDINKLIMADKTVTQLS